jgi:hypothetical protein
MFIDVEGPPENDKKTKVKSVSDVQKKAFRRNPPV